MTDMFPWPPAEDASAIDALGKTWIDSMFRPKQFFAAMPKEESSKPALVYGLILGLVSTFISLFWSFILAGAPSEQEVTAEAIMANPWEMLLQPSRPSLIDLLLSPLYVIGALFIGAAIVHVMLMMFVRERGSYGRTLRVMCYTRSPAVFAVIPFVGLVVGGIWSIVVTIVGVREAHTTTTGRAAAAVLLPGGCLLLLAAILLVVGAAIVASIGAG
jgi:hypothetical protein